MVYMIVLVGGVIAGFVVPPSKRAFGSLLLTGIVFLAAVSVLAAFSSADVQRITQLLLLMDNPSGDKLGLIQLAAVAYGCIVASFVVGVRALSARPREN